MGVLRDFEEKGKKNWLKGVLGLSCLQKPLELFIDKQTGLFYEELRNICGRKQCKKKCDLNNGKPKPKQDPPLDCEVCPNWRKSILENHTSPQGKVNWKNSEPHLWSLNKWEVAKVYMTDGHKKHKALGDFDIASLLCVMNQCKHFKKFELRDLCTKVSNVRNEIMHSARYQLTKEDLDSYLDRIRALGEVLAKHDPQFQSLSEEIKEIGDLDFSLVAFPDTMEADIQARHEKQLENMFFNFAQSVVEHSRVKKELDKMKGKMAQLEQENKRLAAAYQSNGYILARMSMNSLERKLEQLQENTHLDLEQLTSELHRTRMDLDEMNGKVAELEQENMRLAAAHQSAYCTRTRMMVKKLERNQEQLQENTNLDNSECDSGSQWEISADLISQWENELLQERLQELLHAADADDTKTQDTEHLKMLGGVLQANRDLAERFSAELQAINSLEVTE